MSALVLNGNVEPLSIVDVKELVLLVYQNKVRFLYPEEEALVQESLRSRVLPKEDVIVQIQKYVHHKSRPIRASRKHIILRDNSTCQYCGKVYPIKELTVDHIIPVSRGGGNTWKNLVTACKKCNTKKGSCTPEEAKMPLKAHPGNVSYDSETILFVGHHELYLKYRKLYSRI